MIGRTRRGAAFGHLSHRHMEGRRLRVVEDFVLESELGDDFLSADLVVDPAVEDVLAKGGWPGARRREDMPAARTEEPAFELLPREDAEEEEKKARRASAWAASRRVVLDPLCRWETARVHADALGEVRGRLGMQPFFLVGQGQRPGFEARKLEDLLTSPSPSEASSLYVADRIRRTREGLPTLRRMLAGGLHPSPRFTRAPRRPSEAPTRATPPWSLTGGVSSARGWTRS